MFCLPNLSLINTKIAQFYKRNATEELDNVAAYFQCNGAFNSEKIVKHLWPNLGADEVFKGKYLEIHSNKILIILIISFHILCSPRKLQI